MPNPAYPPPPRTSTPDPATSCFAAASGRGASPRVIAVDRGVVLLPDERRERAGLPRGGVAR